MTTLTRVCVYCGSNRGFRPAYAEAAQRFGRALAQRGLGLVYGGGCVGLMGIVADAAMAAGAEVDGVIPEFLNAKEVGHKGLTRLHVVGSMHERKTRMAELADAFVALPGGLGTWEEIFEVATWTQIGLQSKPIGLLDVEGYYGPLRAMLDRAVDDGFLRPEHRALIVVDESAERVLDAFASWQPGTYPKWLDLEKT
jgi:hypothetical protein